ncbi:hypothetical protein BJX61DRAFT_41631 [Aspergillus egyptiacus]|nr:hypothetical protein BJX61DRAFT_41631 [Aspergillus egyptiacus]
MIPKPTHSSVALDFTRELEAMIKFSQRKYAELFVNLYGWFQDKGSTYLVMGYFPLGDLNGYLSQPLPGTEAQQITHQILQGLQHLQQRNMFVIQAGS